MGIETERKFLIKDDTWKKYVYRTEEIVQGYLLCCKECTVRVRITEEKNYENNKKAAYLTIKGHRNNISRSEFEYEIPTEDAEAILKELCGTRILKKKRNFIKYREKIWIADEFSGSYENLVISEIELENGFETVDIPPWVSEEVSDDIRYTNAYLAMHQDKLCK